MEQCFRIAFWMFVLMGCLQANPICFGQGDFGFCDLRQEITCKNVNFTTPTNVEKKCHNAALEHFKDGLKKASVTCEGDKELIYSTLGALISLPSLTIQQNSTECNLETKQSQFKNFVNNMETFVQSLKSIN